MGKKLIIKGADFHVNAITDTSYEMFGEILQGSWVVAGSQIGSGKTLENHKIAIFEVVPGDAYTVSTDKSSSAIGFTATKPTAGANVPYVDGERHLAVPENPTITGVVPAGAHYVSFGMYASDAGNLFPESATFGDGYIDCDDYR